MSNQPADRFPARKEHIAIIGAGIAGLVAALTLQEAGFAVTLYERSGQIGPESCSWLAGGMIAPWCECESAEPCVMHYGQVSLDWWLKHEVHIRQRGSLLLSASRDRNELRQVARRTEAHQWLDAPGIAALEPALENEFHEGLFFPAEAHLDPRLVLPSLSARFLAQKGVLHLNHEADETSLKEDFVIDCRGFSARGKLADLRGVRGEMLRLRSRDVNFSRPVRLLHPRQSVYMVPREERGVLMVGATSLETEDNGPVTVRSAMHLLDAVQRLHPALGEAEILEFNAGIRPAFPDNLPDIRQEGRIWRVNGFYRHGFLLSPYYAMRLREQILACCGDPT